MWPRYIFLSAVKLVVSHSFLACLVSMVTLHSLSLQRNPKAGSRSEVPAAFSVARGERETCRGAGEKQGRSHESSEGQWALGGHSWRCRAEVCYRQGAAWRGGSSEMSPVWLGLSKWDFTSVTCVVSSGFQAHCYWAWGPSESTGPLKNTRNSQASRN